MADPVTVIARLRAKPGQEARVRELLLSLIKPTRAEAGCIDYDLHESDEHPGEFLFYESWNSGEAFEAHLKMPYITEAFKLAPEILDGSPQLTRWKRLD